MSINRIKALLWSKPFLLLNLAALLSHSALLSQAERIRDGHFYIDGQRFFVKGIGYETHTRPGQVPWVYRFDRALIELDLQRIKTAGFNTIRTWGALSEEELKLVQQSGLKILFGIWLDPEGPFGTSAYSQAALTEVRRVLAFSKKYDCILGYLIMNEPQVENIFKGDAAALASIWQNVTRLIAVEHPGVPVSFSNTIIGDFIRTDFWGFAAYNAYMYNPVTITASHGYAGYLELLKHARASNMPMVITEFGLSVSPPPVAPGYGYGGNTLAQQSEGDLFMYRSLIDAGCDGGCVFQYHDGWWKGGKEWTHEATPEEWFGLFHFDDGAPKEGRARPVWDAFTIYNRALILSPRNGHIYTTPVPVELYCEAAVKRVHIYANDQHFTSLAVSGRVTTGELPLSDAGSMQDYQLRFEFVNEFAQVLKTETITLLCARPGTNVPSLTLTVTPLSLKANASATVILLAKSATGFTIKDNRIDYVFHPHIGFDPGEARNAKMTFSNNRWQGTYNFTVPTNCRAATFGAGFTVQKGNFSKRIYAQEIRTVGDWAAALADNSPISGVTVPESQGAVIESISLAQNYPNPFNARTVIAYELPNSGSVQIKIYNLRGEMVATLLDEAQGQGYHEVFWQADGMPSGIYFCRLITPSGTAMRKLALTK